MSELVKEVLSFLLFICGMLVLSIAAKWYADNQPLPQTCLKREVVLREFWGGELKPVWGNCVEWSDPEADGGK